MAETNAAHEVGTKATVTIEATAEGEFLIGLDFYGQRTSKSPSAVQCLAMTGVEAICEAIRETFNVKKEEIVRGAGAATPIH